MRRAIVWARLLGIEDAVVEGVEHDQEADAIVVSVRVARRQRRRCGVCGRRSKPYDAGEGRRRWRALDLGSMRAFIEAAAPRVRCQEDGVVVAAVPWARHGSRFTRQFEEQATWLAVHVSKTTLAELMRIAWRSVGRIIQRVAEAACASRDLLAGLKRIGIDEVSFRRGHKYLIVVVNHDTGRVVWAAEGRDEATVERFFIALGARRCAAVEFVSSDGAAWIQNVVRRLCPQARLCMDSFHVVSWATNALDEVRRAVWNATRWAGRSAIARELKGARFVLWKNRDDLRPDQQATLAAIARYNKPLFRAYLLKEQLRQVFRLRWPAARRLLDDWLKWARRSRLHPFVKVARSITAHRGEIEHTLRYGLTNARIEAVNTRVRLLTRIAFGFHSAQPLVAMIMLALGGLCPALPGRS